MPKSISDNDTSPENLLHSIIDTTFFGLLNFKSIRDGNGKIMDFECIFANKTASKMLGPDTSELIGAKMLDVLPEQIGNGFLKEYKQLVETGKFTKVEQHCKTDKLDGWFQISASKLGDGFTVTFQDISDVKKMQADLTTRGNKYQKLFDESMDAIYLMDSNLNFINVNSSFQNLFGFKQDQVKGTSIKMLFLEKKDFIRFERNLKNNKNIDELEVVLVTKKENQRYCLINSVPVFDEEKQEQNYLGVIRDMTKRIQAEKDIITAEKMSMTGSIARTIAHEIRNPLTNLSLALEQLKEEIPPEVEDAELYLNIIERNTNRIGKLITDLLNSSKPKELNLVHQPIQALVSDALELVQDRLNLQNIKLVQQYGEQQISLPLDGDQMKIALVNLFVNAIESMKPDRGVLKITEVIHEDHVELNIQDNGKGIQPSDIKKLFEPFFTGKKEGSGLGLTTVQNIIHSHNGKIEVKSKPGQGSTFTIRFRSTV